MREQITTKANTLLYLQKKIKKGKIEKIVKFTVKEWNSNKNNIIEEIVNKFFPDQIIVRSSAIGEDSSESSEAGKYKSIQKISTKNKRKIEDAIKDVIETYSQQKNENELNQILIQKQTTGVISNGVVFTKTPDNGSPYYVVNFSDSSHTDDVTKGETSNLIYIFREIEDKEIPKKWKQLIASIKEIEDILKTNSLDIEFGITKKSVIIFQVRPLTTIKENKQNKIEKEIKKLILKNQKKFNSFKLISKKSNENYFSDMADWNPSEIIGTNPNPLDYSLYDFLFMKNSWQLGRIKIGYENNLQENLMENYGNKPYINLKKSFESFFPDTLQTKIKRKLLKFYLKKIKENPYLHDKVEFDILFSCYDFSFDQRAKELRKSGFDNNEIIEIKKKMIEFTNNIIQNFASNKEICMNESEKMTKNRKIIQEQLKRKKIDHFTAAKQLLEDCKILGAINFASMARIAFIGNILLKSLKNNNTIDDKFVNEIMESISSPLSEIQRDLNSYSEKKISKKNFLEKYGHLRPGTYDITAKRYDENHEFLENIKFSNQSHMKTKNQKKELGIRKILKKTGFDFNESELIEFIKESTRLREVLKFEFTKNLSDALLLITKGGEKINLYPQDLAFLQIDDIFNYIKTKGKTYENWKRKIEKNKKIKKINEFLILPPLIFSETDFNIIKYSLSKPNFISTKKVTAEVEKIEKNSNKKIDFANKIVVIENADPGYDWIFTNNPSGLITKYGGVASHMAIRCAELGLPAAIGVGEIIFQRIKNAKTVLLDCENKQVMVLENLKNELYIEEKKILKSLGYIK